MLTQLRITNVGVIEDAGLELAPGMTVITGETGAGKTMIVSGLGLLLGDRADSAVVRQGATRALVEGRLTELEALSEAIEAAGGELDDGEVLASRAVQANGRSRAMLGGAQVPVGTLGALLGEVATIHGQSEQMRLGTPERQREVVDAHGAAPLARVLDDYRQTFQQHRALTDERDELVASARERAREADLLRFGLDEIAALDPQPGEDRALAEESERLQAVDDLRQLAGQADLALAGSPEGDPDAPGAIGLVGTARKLIDKVADLDHTAEPLRAQLSEASALVADAAAEVASYLADLDADPTRLEQVTSRRAQLAGLTRKYGSDVDEVLAWSVEAATKLGALTSSDERIDELTAEIDRLGAKLATLAAELTERRRASATDLAEQVGAELAALAMPNARISFELRPLPELGPHGAESVHLLLAANRGATPAPLAKVASGGELSRIRLAIEVVLADTVPGHTFVFDEVDAGVGGAVALEVGRRLARLATHAQVIVVTHLAQVAAFADRHWVIAKTDDGQVTTSDLRELDASGRAAELARMMGGLADQAGLEHARALLGEAANR